MCNENGINTDSMQIGYMKKKRKGDKKMTSSVRSAQSYHRKHKNDNQNYFQEYMYFFNWRKSKKQKYKTARGTES